MNSEITLTEIESAINFWRQRLPSVGEELRLCDQASALANHYAIMIVSGTGSMPVDALEPTAREAYEVWLAQNRPGGLTNNPD
ncbi:DUF3717 domain-containing protein [Orrella marina]|uniref:DUF3717 domain-containing protein n=1 Tax=Orrella marina TaxID=2163011 RepID=A0A2R4XM95_9BURK|nr:DUF3717 domain-containing protein [Orrella marina]AWB34920.1 hypothetical protein DBV39_15600 [Orrella marina]